MSYRWPVLLMCFSQAIWLVLAWTRQPDDEIIWAQFSSQIAYGFAAVYFYRAANEYPSGARLGLAFRLLSWTALFSILRHGLDNPLLQELAPALPGAAYQGLIRQVLITFAVTGLLASLLLMAATIRKLRLGFRLRRRDIAGVVLAGALAVTIGARPAGLSESTSPYPVALWLQMANLFVLLAAAGVSCVLTGLSGQMGGGSLVRCFQLLSAHSLLRALLVALGLFPVIRSLPGFVETAGFLFQFGTWLFALASAARAHLSEIEQAQSRQPRVLNQALIEKLLLNQH